MMNSKEKLAMALEIIVKQLQEETDEKKRAALRKRMREVARLAGRKDI